MTTANNEQQPAVQVDVSARSLARNTMLNLVGQVVPLLAAVFAVPYVVHHLGPDRYGLYSLALIVVGYFALFNLGIGPATTKYVAELLGTGEVSGLPRLVWTAIASQACLGLAGGILLAAASPFLIGHVLKIPAGLHAQAQAMFLIMAVALPVDFIAGSLRGVLSASQRFDLLNAVDVPVGALMGVIPAAVIALGAGLPAIVLSLVVLRTASATVVFALSLRLHPALRRVEFDFSLVRPLLGFGGWVTISGAVVPILMYADQLLIGALISVAAVGYYAPAYSIANKLTLLPGCLVSTLFPAFSTSAGRGDSEWIRKTMLRSLKFLILTVGPAALLLIFFARQVLTFWLGAKFAKEGALALQILSGASFIVALTYTPLTLLQGIGRPDLAAKIHLAQVPIHLVLVCALALRFGLPGAALACALRVTFEFVLVAVAACWITRTSPRRLASTELGRSIGALVVLAVGLLILCASTQQFIADAAFSILLGAGFLLAAWNCILNVEEKWQIRLWLKVAR